MSRYLPDRPYCEPESLSDGPMTSAEFDALVRTVDLDEAMRRFREQIIVPEQE